MNTVLFRKLDTCLQLKDPTVPLKILLADDSMTAQKMGKDILAGAGYEVIAVSNGAAAAKKLSEKPDIAIFDIIMPGYSGLELCERVRAGAATAKMPVLLTVGKMEHYEQRDVQRVKADGVIIKPFEATDLLAVVKKLAENSKPQVEAPYEKTMIFTPPHVQNESSGAFAPPPVPDATEEYGNPPAPAVVMSKEVGAAPAFMMDDNAAVDVPPLSAPASLGSSPYGPVEPAVEAAATASAAPSTSQFGASPFMEIEGRSLPEASGAQLVEPTASTAPEIITTPDPALITGPSGFSDFTVSVSKPAEASSATLTPLKTQLDDFEAKVAAVPADYGKKPTIEAEPFVEPTTDPAVEKLIAEAAAIVTSTASHIEESRSTEQEADAGASSATPSPANSGFYADLPASQQPPPGMQDAAIVEQMQAAMADTPVATTPSTYVEPATEQSEIVVVSEGPVSPRAQDLELAKALAAAVGAETPSAAQPAVATGSATSKASESSAAARAVRRVLERMLPTIMNEVAKELDDEKKS